MGQLIKTILFSAVLFSVVLFSSGALYAMGGGGSHGDGRQEFSETAGTSSSGSANSGLVTRASTPTVVPEPMAALLLGLGIIGVVGLRRKFRK